MCHTPFHVINTSILSISRTRRSSEPQEEKHRRGMLQRELPQRRDQRSLQLLEAVVNMTHPLNILN